MSEPLSQEVLAGPNLSKWPGEVTTIWRDGEVVRQTNGGRTVVLAPVDPIAEVRE